MLGSQGFQGPCLCRGCVREFATFSVVAQLPLTSWRVHSSGAKKSATGSCRVRSKSSAARFQKESSKIPVTPATEVPRKMQDESFVKLQGDLVRAQSTLERPRDGRRLAQFPLRNS
jgi:hypothetical protein